MMIPKILSSIFVNSLLTGWEMNAAFGRTHQIEPETDKKTEPVFFQIHIFPTLNEKNLYTFI